jgi:hypothetical protein
MQFLQDVPHRPLITQNITEGLFTEGRDVVHWVFRSVVGSYVNGRSAWIIGLHESRETEIG